MKTCTVRAHAGQTILEALRGDHHAIDAPCGGRTRCIRCMVQVSDDSTQSPIVEPPSSEEGALVGQTRLADGWRLACRARLVTSGDISLKVPDGRLEIPDFPVRARKWSNAAQRTDGQFVIARRFAFDAHLDRGRKHRRGQPIVLGIVLDRLFGAGRTATARGPRFFLDARRRGLLFDYGRAIFAGLTRRTGFARPIVVLLAILTILT